MATDRHQAQSYPLRMPEELKQLAAEAADKNGRSLHAELLHRLQNSFDDSAVDSSLVLDQAVQIWEARQRAASAYAAIGIAIDALAEDGPEGRAEAIEALKAARDQTYADARDVLNRLLHEQAGRAGGKVSAQISKLISAISNHD